MYFFFFLLVANVYANTFDFNIRIYPMANNTNTIQQTSFRDLLGTLFGGAKTLLSSTINVSVNTLDTVDRGVNSVNQVVQEVELDTSDSLYEKQQMSSINRTRIDARVKVETAKIESEVQDMLSGIAGA